MAKNIGFEDHKELEAFMKQQGYAWSGQDGNYIPLVEEENEEMRMENSEETNDKHMNGGVSEELLLSQKILCYMTGFINLWSIFHYSSSF